MFFKSYHFDFQSFSSLRLVSKMALALVLLSGLSYPALGMNKDSSENNGTQQKRPRPPENSSEDNQGTSKRPRTTDGENAFSASSQPPYSYGNHIPGDLSGGVQGAPQHPYYIMNQENMVMVDQNPFSLPTFTPPPFFPLPSFLSLTTNQEDGRADALMTHQNPFPLHSFHPFPFPAFHLFQPFTTNQEGNETGAFMTHQNPFPLFPPFQLFTTPQERDGGPDRFENLPDDLLYSILNPWLLIESSKNVKSLGSLFLTSKRWVKLISDFRDKEQNIPCYLVERKIHEHILGDIADLYLQSLRHALPKQKTFHLKLINDNPYNKSANKIFNNFSLWSSLTSLTLERDYGLSCIIPYLTNLTELSLTYKNCLNSDHIPLSLPQLQRLTLVSSLDDRIEALKPSWSFWKKERSIPEEVVPSTPEKVEEVDSLMGLYHLDHQLPKLVSMCPNLTSLNLERPIIGHVTSLESLSTLTKLDELHLNIQGLNFYKFTPGRFTILIKALQNVKFKSLTLGGDVRGIAGAEEITPDHPDLHTLFLRNVDVIWDPQDVYYPQNAPIKKDPSEENVPIKCNKGWEDRKYGLKHALGNADQ